ncbi:hypothetical protein HQ585_16320 [candidate division KSB1 bacterium]|nr:hypothetical protein [candidate division KSB1 bacterium]
MPVRIQSIQVEQLGPIKRFSMKPRLLNLIYGHNEHGKTYLVEFLMRSLFRIDKRWRTRDAIGAGKVVVTGLDDRKIEFLPRAGEKIDDFWEKSTLGLPPQFHRLLVVKGAELELFDDDPEGMDGKVLKKYLSNQMLLDRIEEYIPATVRDAQILDGQLSGQNRPPLKTRTELLQKLQELDTLFEQIEKGWLSGRRKHIEDTLQKSINRLNQMEQARCFQAYQLSEKLKQIESRIAKLDANRFQELKDSFRSFQQKFSELEKVKNVANTLEGESVHYLWLKNAVLTYRQLLENPVRMPGLLFPILAAIFLLGCGTFIYLSDLIPALASLGCAITLILVYIIRLRRSLQKKPYEDERVALEEAYQFRFEEPLKDLAQMEARHESMRSIHEKSKYLSDEVRDGESVIEKLGIEVEAGIVSIAGKKLPEDQWDDILLKAEQTLDQLNREREIQKEQFDKLDVDPSDFIQDDPGLIYSKQKHQEFQDTVHSLQEELQGEDQKLNTLKQMICSQTGDSISSDWETIIDNLRLKRETIAKEYREITADILGKKAVHNILESLRKDEHRKIAEGLSSETILQPLHKITHRYSGLRLENDKLILSDELHDFPFSDLSTGAQEQVLMALRIGFSLKNLGKQADPLFLILDDAFQYSDYERREWLVQTVTDLARSGWQIFYFTMDDHIRDLFNKAGKTFGDDYVEVEL